MRVAHACAGALAQIKNMLLNISGAVYIVYDFTPGLNALESYAHLAWFLCVMNVIRMDLLLCLMYKTPTYYQPRRPHTHCCITSRT